MNKTARVIKYSVLVLLLSTFKIPSVNAQVDLGLCPNGYSQGLVTTGFISCHRESGRRSTREQAEADRLDREAVCRANPNSEVTSSEIIGTSSGGFFSRITCTVTRQIPPGTTLCPENSDEVSRAFDTLVCQNFGSATDTAEEAQQALDMLVAECTSTEGGRVVSSELNEEMFDGITFFTSSLACALPTAAVDNIECPFRFDETGRDENTIECEVNERTFETIEEAMATNISDQSICTDTTAGLGSVDEESMTGMTSNGNFFSLVVCNIRIARYGDFVDDTVLRACDASCTEEIEQARNCINGGVIGGPGCVESSTQVIERKCNTGPDPKGLCQLILPSAYISPLILLDED